MGVYPWKSTGWPVLTAMTGGVAGSTGSSDCWTGELPSPIGLVNATTGGWLPASFLETDPVPARLSILGPVQTLNWVGFTIDYHVLRT